MISTHCKLSWAGRGVLRAHNKEFEYGDSLHKKYLIHQSQHRPLLAMLHARGVDEGFGKLIPNMMVTLCCIYFRHTVPALTLCLIIGRTEMIGHMASG